MCARAVEVGRHDAEQASIGREQHALQDRDRASALDGADDSRQERKQRIASDRRLERDFPRGTQLLGDGGFGHRHARPRRVSIADLAQSRRADDADRGADAVGAHSDLRALLRLSLVSPAKRIALKPAPPHRPRRAAAGFGVGLALVPLGLADHADVAGGLLGVVKGAKTLAVVVRVGTAEGERQDVIDLRPRLRTVGAGAERTLASADAGAPGGRHRETRRGLDRIARAGHDLSHDRTWLRIDARRSAKGLRDTQARLRDEVLAASRAASQSADPAP